MFQHRTISPPRCLFFIQIKFSYQFLLDFQKHSEKIPAGVFNGINGKFYEEIGGVSSELIRGRFVKIIPGEIFKGMQQF